MSSPTPTSELASHPAEDVQAVSALCRTRILEREGIAMFVELHDARPGHHLHVRDATGVAEGARLAVLFDHYERGLAAAQVDAALSESGAEGEVTSAADPDPDIDPTGAAGLIDVLVVLSDQHLQARTELSP